VKFPDPAPGLVIRYSFLWKEDYEKGKYEASKERPCAVVLAAKVKDTTAIQVVVVPITHSEPDDQSASLEMPAAVAKALGLDNGRHWLRLTQLNRFIWPGYDLRPRPDDSGRVDYGFIPENLFNQIKAAIVAENKRKKLSFTSRDQ
jgi:hypothetical protein